MSSKKPYRLFSLTWRSPFSKFSDDGKSQKGIRRKANGGDSSMKLVRNSITLLFLWLGSSVFIFGPNRFAVARRTRQAQRLLFLHRGDLDYHLGA